MEEEKEDSNKTKKNRTCRSHGGRKKKLLTRTRSKTIEDNNREQKLGKIQLRDQIGEN